MGEKIKVTSDSEAGIVDHYTNPDWTNQRQFKLLTKDSTPPTTPAEKYSSFYPKIYSEFEGSLNQIRKISISLAPFALFPLLIFVLLIILF